MENCRSYIKRHSVLSYFALTFAISWGGLVLLLGGPGNITSGPSTAPFLPMYFMTVAGPCIAGLFLTGFCHGKDGYRRLFARLRTWRVGAGWYAAALLAAPVTVFAALWALWLYSPVFLPGIFSSGDNAVATTFGLAGNDKVTLVLFVLVLGLFNGTVEELGWTGFATPEMRANHTLITTGLTIGVMWGLWHFLSNFVGSDAGAGTVPLVLFMPAMLFTFLPPFRMLMTWVYDRTESLLIAILMHASLDVFWMLSMPNVLTGSERVIWYVAWAAILWIAVAVVARVNGAVYERRSVQIS